MRKFKTLSIVVPCYNEEETIKIFYNEVEKYKKEIGLELEYIFINDGSKDKTLEVLREISKENNNIKYLSFSRNFGKESAMYAGLKYSTGDLITIMDADLQDPPEMLPVMLKKLNENDLECVGTRRETRKGEPPIRSFFARMFYKLINKISDTEVIDGARDFRLMTRKMVNVILDVKEYNRFSKGIFSWVGFKTEYISYENRERVAGNTSWSFMKLFRYSLDGIVNFSTAPLNIAIILGILTCIVSVALMAYLGIKTLVWGNPTPGWTSLMCGLLLLSGIQLLTIGILGKYIGQIFLETKKRPIFIVDETNGEENGK